jgi:hypothetical protein
MSEVTAVDLTGLNRFVSELFGALLGAGKGGEGDAQQFVKVQAGLLAQEISRELGPKTLEGAEKRIELDVRKFMSVKPDYSNLNDDLRLSKQSDWTWLSAGPRFLLGIDDLDLKEKVSAGEALRLLRAEQTDIPHGRGNAYIEKGMRGKQHVLRLNRIKVSKMAFAGMVQAIKREAGLLRASFAWTAQRLLQHAKAPPQWVSRHFDTQAGGRALFNISAINHPTSPSIEFGSTAKGVVDNPIVAGKIAHAVERRKAVMASTLGKVIKGYTYDWNTGRVFRSKKEVIDADI